MDSRIIGQVLANLAYYTFLALVTIAFASGLVHLVWHKAKRVWNNRTVTYNGETFFHDEITGEDGEE